jgi:hypothetical protein
MSTSRAKNGAIGEQRDDEATLIFDKTYSQPASATFKEGDKIVEGGVSYFVRSVEAPEDSKGAPLYYRLRLK